MDTSWDEKEAAWNKHLSRLSREVDISSELVWSSRQQLITIFGQDWLEGELLKHKKATPLTKKGVVGLITNPIVNNAVGVVELAKYLKAVSYQENFGEIVTKLKNANDYEAIRLNLAVGYRLKSVGWQEVYVEPRIGDVEGVYNSQKYVVECSMIDPPKPLNVYLQVLFDNFYKYLKKNRLKTWVHVEFLKNPIEVNQNELIRDLKASNYQFVPSGQKIETKTEAYKITQQILSSDIQTFLREDRERENGNVVDIGYQLANHKAPDPKDVYSVDLDDETGQIDLGWVTFGGVRKNDNSKSTEEQLMIKIKSKKSQTNSLPDDVRRMFTFQVEGKVEDEDIVKISEVVRRSIKATDNIDDIMIFDRRHQTAFEKLRYPSGQYHILIARERLPYLEKMVTDLKAFEYSDWIAD